MRPRPSTRNHLSGGVDADDLALDSEVSGKGEGRIAETAPHVQKPLTIVEAQLLPLPYSQPPVAFNLAVVSIVARSTATFGSSSTCS